MPAPAGRFVPRPPQSLGSSNNNNAMPNRGVSNPTMSSRTGASEPTQTAMNHNVPRPPQSGVRSLSQPSTSPLSRSMPQSAVGNINRPTTTARNTVPNAAPRSYSTPYFGRERPAARRVRWDKSHLHRATTPQPRAAGTTPPVPITAEDMATTADIAATAPRRPTEDHPTEARRPRLQRTVLQRILRWWPQLLRAVVPQFGFLRRRRRLSR